MMYKKVMASALLWAALTASAGAFDYNQSVDEIAESPLTAYQTVYLGMPRADFDANFSILPDWTFYGSSVSFTERAERTSVVKNVSVTEGIEIFSADTSAKGKVLVCQGSRHKEYSEEEASKILAEEEIQIYVDMHQGEAEATAWGCDLTYDYVKINGDYRS